MFVRYHFLYDPCWRERFCAGRLSRRWFKLYPHLFTRHDLRLANNQPRNHFYEWLGAVLLYEATGYHSCLKWCNEGVEAGKVDRFRRLAGAELADEIIEWAGGHPDLLVYARDESDWFFCEVKGNTDCVKGNQFKAARRIYRRTGRRVRLLELTPLRTGE